jgi:hypothetical protein
MKPMLRVTTPSSEFVLPAIVTGNEPAGVLNEVLIERLTLTGLPAEGDTVGGVNRQLAPAGKPLQTRVTIPLNEPEAVTERTTG